MAEKMVYVPRNWKVSYVDETGNEVKDFELSANCEYRIVCGNIEYFTTIGGIRTEDGKTFILGKVLMNPGYMYVMEKNEFRFNVDDVTSITKVYSEYVSVKRSIREKKESEEIFTFAFESAKYPSKYRISIYGGEFVCLAVKPRKDSKFKYNSLYGHVIDVDTEKNEVIMSRYVSSKHTRDVYTYRVPVDDLLGIYRYELAFNTEPKVRKPKTTETTETAAE